MLVVRAAPATGEIAIPPVNDLNSLAAEAGSPRSHASPDTISVVIPYFKPSYLEAALDSLASQRDARFSVFIGDDCSPDDPAAILEKYRGRLNITYKKFAENLGKTSLSAHWTRCVAEVRSEWVWLFSDDDVASPDCVSRFREAVVKTDRKYDVYRFNLCIIDARGQKTHTPPVHPLWESSREFAFAKILDGRYSMAVEYVFRRAAFVAMGEFPQYPLAWCADDASWLILSRKTGIFTIADTFVSWRNSGINLSTPSPVNAAKKLEAWRKYLEWILTEFPDPEFHARYRAVIFKWFPEWVMQAGECANFLDGFRFWLFFRRYTGRTSIVLLFRFAVRAAMRHLRVKPGSARRAMKNISYRLSPS